MRFSPISTDLHPEEFEIEGVKFSKPTFFRGGYLAFVKPDGNQRSFPLGEIGGGVSGVKWRVDEGSPAVKVRVSGFAIICGEYEDETSRNYQIEVNGPEAKIKKLKRALLEQQGFEVV